MIGSLSQAHVKASPQSLLVAMQTTRPQCYTPLTKGAIILKLFVLHPLMLNLSIIPLQAIKQYTVYPKQSLLKTLPQNKSHGVLLSYTDRQIVCSHSWLVG